jgi:molybdopterin-guanine dinucleotide biosynthesis protein A
VTTGRVPVAGVILAGGRGTRMGGADKGWVQWQGRFLVERVLDRLAPQVDRVTISANRNLERYRGLGVPVVEDEPAAFGPYAGPLAGMLAALRHCALPCAVFVPCDAPALAADLVARLVAGAGDAATASVACSGGYRQPVFCLLPTSLAPRLAQALASGERRPDAFLATVGAREVHFDDAAAFANVNWPAAPGTGVAARGADGAAELP